MFTMFTQISIYLSVILYFGCTWPKHCMYIFFFHLVHSGLRATRNGLLVLDSIIPHLLAAMSHLQERQGLQVNVI